MSGKLIVFSAPSGAGKTTIVRRIMQLGIPMRFSVSATSRKARENETHGIDYFFLSIDEFRDKIKENAFVEWEEVYENQFYGSLRSEVDRSLNAGDNLLFDIDVMGGIAIKKMYGEQALSIFIMPPSVIELEKRLLLRGTESEESLKKRISKAETELRYSSNFDLIIINDDLEKAIKQVYEAVIDFIKQ